MEYIPDVPEKITDLSSCHKFLKSSYNYKSFVESGCYYYSFAYRMLVEAILAGDEAEARVWAERTDEKYRKLPDFVLKARRGVELQELAELPGLLLEGGMGAAMNALKKVRNSNMRKLKRGGIVE